MIYAAKPEDERRGRSCLADRVLLSFRRSPRQSIVPNDDRHLTTPIPFISNYLIFPLPLPLLPKVAQGTSIPPPPLPSPPRSPRAMTALPSFVELMATLGLDNKPSPPPTVQELSSPSIIVSSEYEQTQEHISSRIRVSRYSPYGAPIVSVAAAVARFSIEPLIMNPLRPVSFPPKECFHAFQRWNRLRASQPSTFPESSLFLSLTRSADQPRFTSP